jgi:cytidine deaminase
LSGSDRPTTWPAGDRRQKRDRRAGADRRAAARNQDAQSWSGPDRRTGDRRIGERRNEAAWEALAVEPPAATSADSQAALLAAAIEARTRAHARFSGFKVGAALESADGRVILGCNIENATYGLTLCAERVALVKALSDGHGVFTRIAVVADTVDPTPPCGPCRQLLWEFCGDIDVILGNLDGPTGRYRLSALLPLPFDARLLG